MEEIKLTYILRAMNTSKCGLKFNGQQKTFLKFSEICNKFLIPSKYPNKNKTLVNTEKGYPAAPRGPCCVSCL